MVFITEHINIYSYGIFSKLIAKLKLIQVSKTSFHHYLVKSCLASVYRIHNNTKLTKS